MYIATKVFRYMYVYCKTFIAMPAALKAFLNVSQRDS